MIHIEQFSWQFADSDDPVLHDVSLNISRGELLVLAGPSGSGKSTLAQAMCGLLIGRQNGDHQGTIVIDGHNVITSPLHELARTIGLVQQNPETQFATMTVDDEIVFGLENHCLPPNEILERKNIAMGQTDITHLRGRQLASLSGGEQQRVAIASIMAGGLRAIVLDEPTAALDPAAASKLFRTLQNLCRDEGLTVIIVEHRLDHLIPIRPRFVELRNGRVQELNTSSIPSSSASEPVVHAATPCPDVASGEPLVEMEGLSVAYGNTEILHNVTLHIEPNEFVAIMGPNGGGKTTLLHSICGLTKPRSGTVLLQRRQMADLSVRELAMQIGMVFQNADHQLVADSVWKEALYTSNTLGITSEETGAYAERLLKAAGIFNRRHDHPYCLSWGEKRRLNVISALLHLPKLLLLDEPFAGQDWECLPFFKSALTSSRTPVDSPPNDPYAQMAPACIMVTHDSRIVRQCCTRIVFVDRGSVVIDDKPDQAFMRMSEMGYRDFIPRGEFVE